MKNLNLEDLTDTRPSLTPPQSMTKDTRKAFAHGTALQGLLAATAIGEAITTLRDDVVRNPSEEIPAVELGATFSWLGHALLTSAGYKGGTVELLRLLQSLQVGTADLISLVEADLQVGLALVAFFENLNLPFAEGEGVHLLGATEVGLGKPDPKEKGRSFKGIHVVRRPNYLQVFCPDGDIRWDTPFGKALRAAVIDRLHPSERLRDFQIDDPDVALDHNHGWGIHLRCNPTVAGHRTGPRCSIMFGSAEDHAQTTRSGVGSEHDCRQAHLEFNADADLDEQAKAKLLAVATAMCKAEGIRLYQKPKGQ